MMRPNLDDSNESYDAMQTAPTSPLQMSKETSPEKPCSDATMTPTNTSLTAHMSKLKLDSLPSEDVLLQPDDVNIALSADTLSGASPVPKSIEAPRFQSTPSSKAPFNSATIVRKPATLQHSSSTESASGKEDSPRKRHERQKTMTVVHQGAQEVQRIVSEVRALEGDVDVMAELEQRMIMLIASRDREAAAKSEKLGQMLVAAKADAQKAQDELLSLREVADVTERFLRACVVDNFNAAVARSRSTHSDPSSPAKVNFHNGKASSPRSTAQLEKIEKERDQLKEEVGQVHQQYATLFTTYEKQRAAIEQLRSELDAAVAERDAVAKAHVELEDNYSYLRRDAEAQLERMNKAMEQLNRDHEESTLAIRARFQLAQTDVLTKTQELELKNKQIDELNAIIQSLINQQEEGYENLLNGTP